MARYIIKLMTKEVIERDIPREKQGWWADTSAGQRLRVRDATEADWTRCFHMPGSTPADYFCEDFDRGYLIPRYAAATVKPL